MRDMVSVRRQGGKRYDQPNIKIGRSQFDRSHGLKTTFDANYLVPILVDEVYPGDTFTCSLNGFARIFSPLDAPVMDNIEMETFFFFVPNRIIWSNWPFFQGEHDDLWEQDTDYTVPVFAAGLTVDHDNAYDGHGLAAFFGLPEGLTSANHDINSLPFRAYERIYREWFRSEVVEGWGGWTVGDGPDAIGNFNVHKTYKKHDYFTSCLPDTQKGDEVFIPLSGLVDVRHEGTTGADVVVVADGDAGNFHEMDINVNTLELVAAGGVDAERLFVDLSQTTVGEGLNVNDLRYSVAIQRLLEKDARGGTRLVEKIKEHFGVTVPDYTIQRPEYLGGGKGFINISPVANTTDINAATSASAADVFQGELKGIGAGTLSGHSWAKSFVEHGWVIGLIRARADLTYFQGVDKMWSRSVPTDFYLPVLAGLGEQAVLNKELWNSEVPATDDAAFGYQERWAELRMKRSQLTGLFNADIAAGSLSHWHLAEDFAALPTLNQTFLQSNTPMARIRTITTEPDFILDLWFNYKCARPLPVRSIPSLMGQRF